MTPQQALVIARQKALDLVEVAPMAQPPVCKIMDFGKYQYQEQKRQREARKHQKVTAVKEVKFRPKVDEHDYQFKKKHIERFIALLLEHYAGALPLWFAPVQAIVLPIADRHLAYAASVRDRLAAAGVFVELDERQEKIGYKIREAQLQKVPYMLVVGDREAEQGAVSVRTRAGGDQGAQPVEAFIAAVLDEIARKGR